jgi:hypothetical protein
VILLCQHWLVALALTRAPPPQSWCVSNVCYRRSRSATDLTTSPSARRCKA